MNVHLVKHDKSGVGYAVKLSELDNLGNTRWKVKFWQKIDHPVYFPSTCFNQGDLVDLGIIDDTEKLDLFT